MSSKTEATRANKVSTKTSFVAKKPNILSHHASNDKNNSHWNVKAPRLDVHSGSDLPKSSLTEKQTVEATKKAAQIEASTSESSLGSSCKTPETRMRVTPETPSNSATSDSSGNSTPVPKTAKQSKSTFAAAARARKRKQLEKIRNDPEKYAVFKAANKERSRKRRIEGKIKAAKDMTPSELRIQRQKWRKAYHNHKLRQQLAQVGSEFGQMNSASEIEADAEEVEQPMTAGSRNLRWKKPWRKKEESERRISEPEDEHEHYGASAGRKKAKYL